MNIEFWVANVSESYGTSYLSTLDGEKPARPRFPSYLHEGRFTRCEFRSLATAMQAAAAHGANAVIEAEAPPSITHRHLSDAQRREYAKENGFLSAHTWKTRIHNLPQGN